MSKTPYTKVEIVEERHPNQPEDTPLVKPQHVLINGHKVRVAKDGIRIDHGDAGAAVVIHKRHGKGQPGDQWVTLTLADFVALITGEPKELD